jgi:hypothetical protein
VNYIFEIMSDVNNTFFVSIVKSTTSCLPERRARSPQAMVGAVMLCGGVCEGGQAE